MIPDQIPEMFIILAAEEIQNVLKDLREVQNIIEDHIGMTDGEDIIAEVDLGLHDLPELEIETQVEIEIGGDIAEMIEGRYQKILLVGVFMGAFNYV